MTTCLDTSTASLRGMLRGSDEPELHAAVRACGSCSAPSRVSNMHPVAPRDGSSPFSRAPASKRPTTLEFSSPMASHAPRIDSLSNMARERDQARRMQQFQAARKREQKPIGNSKRTSRRESPNRTERAEASTATPELELSTVDLRRRRYLTAIAPTSHSCDFTSRSKGRSQGRTARDLLRANATELMPSRTRSHDNMTSYSCDFTGPTPKMAIRDAMSTDTKDLEISMVDMRTAPTSFSCDFTGPKRKTKSYDATSAKTNELELSTVDLRLPKYKAKLSQPPKKGRRKEPEASSALTPISVESLAAIEAKLSSVEHELQRYNIDNNIPNTKQKPKNPKASITMRTHRASTARSVDLPESKVVSISQEQMLTSNRSRIADKKSVTSWKYRHTTEGSRDGGSPVTTKQHSEPIDFHLSSLDLRPRRNTTNDALPVNRENSPRYIHEPAVEEKEIKELITLQRKSKAKPIDFHLSTFDLKPRSHSNDAFPKSNQEEVNYHQPHSKKKEASPTSEARSPTDSKYAKNDTCDLSYLDNFRSYTV